MNKRIVTVGIVGFIAAISAAIIFIRQKSIAVFQPAGTIASQERDLMLIATFLMLIVVVPVFILTAVIAWRYREGNTKAKYTPEWDHSRLAESVWWGFPLLIILILSVITWQSSHSLDPFRPLASNNAPMTIQVVALQWKWLFIYPEQNIATTNLVHLPEKTPIRFEITADAPMNSFWIPQLGGQIYAMAGMSTHLHLMADKPGNYAGSSANLSGGGFADMKFIAAADSEANFKTWVNSVKQGPNTLNTYSYELIAKPNIHHSPQYYSSVKQGLYEDVIAKYMAPDNHDSAPMYGHYEASL